MLLKTSMTLMISSILIVLFSTFYGDNICEDAHLYFCRTEIAIQILPICGVTFLTGLILFTIGFAKAVLID